MMSVSALPSSSKWGKTPQYKIDLELIKAAPLGLNNIDAEKYFKEIVKSDVSNMETLSRVTVLTKLYRKRLLTIIDMAKIIYDTEKDENDDHPTEDQAIVSASQRWEIEWKNSQEKALRQQPGKIQKSSSGSEETASDLLGKIVNLIESRVSDMSSPISEETASDLLDKIAELVKSRISDQKPDHTAYLTKLAIADEKAKNHYTQAELDQHEGCSPYNSVKCKTCAMILGVPIKNVMVPLRLCDLVVDGVIVKKAGTPIWEGHQNGVHTDYCRSCNAYVVNLTIHLREYPLHKCTLSDDISSPNQCRKCFAKVSNLQDHFYENPSCRLPKKVYQ